MPRDANGNYVLPAGNPVVSGSLIESAWANTTMPDLGAEMQDSLSRSGKGAMLAPMRLVDFDGPTPGLTFGNEPTTGYRRVVAGDTRLSVLGTDVLKMEQALLTASVNAYFTGQVGVGIASPATLFQVNKDQDAATEIRITNATSGVAASTKLSMVPFGSDFSIEAYGDTHASRSDQVWIGSSAANTNLVFQTVGVERLRINDTGNVGIGTASPGASLQVQKGASSGVINANSVVVADNNGDGYFQVITPAANAGGILFGDPGGSAQGALRYYHTDNSMRLNTSNIERMRIDSNGNVGIGTSNPSELLHLRAATPVINLQSSSGATPEGKIQVNDAGSFYFFADSANASGDSQYRWYIDGNNLKLLLDTNGNVGIGVIPESWDSTFTALQVGGLGALWGSTSQTPNQGTVLSNNVYYGSAANRRIVNAAAVRVNMNSGALTLDVAASGAVGSNISWTNAFAIDNSAGVSMPNLPTTNPGGSGRLWNDGGTVKIT